MWHCHIGLENANEYTESAWEFLEPFVADAHRLVFDRALHVPEPLTSRPTAIVPPSIDPFAPKNQPLDQASGLLRASNAIDAQPVFHRFNGEAARVKTRAVFLGGSNAPDPIRPLVLQVSRWDRLKDHLGVMRGFVRRTLPDTNAELMLVGPHVEGVPDDPEGAAVLEALVAEHAALSDSERERVHIASLSVTDLEESDVIVNALQRHASVVVQKSLEEGFGLTVTEALWKGKPVIASSVGGICDQITHEKSGILLEDPHDLDKFGETLTELLRRDGQGQELGTAAQRFVHQTFLHDQHLRGYLKLFASLGEGV
jgi:trehalose synthase